MVYNSERDTSNPFLFRVRDKWDELVEFEGETIIEKVVKSISILIVLCALILLIPVGIILSIYIFFSNLYKGGCAKYTYPCLINSGIKRYKNVNNKVLI